MAIFDGGWDVHEAEIVARRLSSIGASFPTPLGRGPGVTSPFMELYASLAKGHMRNTEQQNISWLQLHPRTIVIRLLTRCRNIKMT